MQCYGTDRCPASRSVLSITLVVAKRLDISRYGSMVGILSLLCLSCCHFLFVRLVTNFSAAEKARGVKFCVHVGLLSGQVFSHFGELWLARSHGSGGSTSGIMAPADQLRQSHGHSELGSLLFQCDMRTLLQDTYKYKIQYK